MVQRHLLDAETTDGLDCLRQHQQELETVSCCGIVGVVGQEPAARFLLDGLRILESRGYDSAGIATADPTSKELTTTKFASTQTTCDAIEKLADAVDRHGVNTIGIAHTRWATHGAKTDSNAHPHVDQEGRIAVVHNGVIENYAILKAELVEKGVRFASETDTEVIAQLIGQYVKETDDVAIATQKTLSRLEGTWGLVVMDRKHPDKLIAAKNGSPILIGISNNKMFVASEASAFSQHTKEFIALENGEMAVITPSGHSLETSRIELAPSETIQLTPAPHPHWTLKEILEQPASISRSLNYGGRIVDDSMVKLGGLEERITQLSEVRHLIIAACGTSYHAGMYGAQLMRYLDSFSTVQVVDAAELSREYIPKGEAGFLAISQSGETKDVARALSIAEELDVPCFSVVNQVRSMLARQTGCGVYLNAGREVAVASTKAFTCQVTVLALIAVWFAQLQHRARADSQRRRNVIEALHRLPTNIGMTINKVRTQMRNLAESLVSQNVQRCFILGKGYGESIAREGSLKIKEISYIHAEGYPGGALKHGPFALIEPGIPVILIILDDQHGRHMKTAAHEVKTRGARTIIITDCNLSEREKHELGPDVVSIPSNGPLTALLSVIPLQLLAYELAIAKKIDPDRPRNLAKAVTVD